MISVDKKQAEEDQRRLIDFFRTDAAYQLAYQGDEYGWTPAQTAIRAMEELLKTNKYPCLDQLPYPK